MDLKDSIFFCLKKLLAAVAIAFATLGCQMQVDISKNHSSGQSSSATPDPNGGNNSSNPGNQFAVESEFVSAELVTTSNGVSIRGTFSELSEKQTLPNGVTIEGVFYQ